MAGKSLSQADEVRVQSSRSAKSQALTDARWRGAAPTGRKRSGSASQANPEPVKKGKSSNQQKVKTASDHNPKKTALRHKVPQAAAAPHGSKRKTDPEHMSSDEGGAEPAMVSSSKVKNRKASRKPPATIPEDGSEEDAMSNINVIRKDLPSHKQGQVSSKKNGRPQTMNSDSDRDISDADSQQLWEESSLDETDPHDDANDSDLEKMDVRGLKSALSSERAQWSSKSTKSKLLDLRPIQEDLFDFNARSDLDQGQDGDGSDSSALVPDIELTTASEPDGDVEQSENSNDEQGEVEGGTQSDDSLDIPRRLSKPKKTSKRELARRAEVPRISTPLSSSRISSRVPLSRESHPQGNNYYVPAQAGARLISLKAQPLELRTVIKAAIREVTGDAMFESTYPSSHMLNEYYRNVLKQSATQLGFSLLSNLLERYQESADVIARLLNVRLSSVRSNLKKTALSEVKGFYQLIPGDNCKMRVKEMTATTSYIFPRSTSGLIHRTKPFQHPCVISILKEFCFTSTRGASLAEKHGHRFKSSISDGPQASELEVPVALLCAVATAIHACLDDWSDGHYRKAEFNADLYEDVYNGHMAFLVEIRDKNPAAFHRLMSDLYKAVSSATTQQASAIKNGALTLLDIDAMDV